MDKKEDCFMMDRLLSGLRVLVPVSIVTIVGAIGCTTTATVGPPADTSCQADSAVSCPGGGDGYSCGAGISPDGAGLDCSDPTPDGSLDDFCCVAFVSTNSCGQDPNEQDCTTPDTYEFRCTTPTDSPDATDSSLTCSSPTTDPNTGDSLYCCTL
jgi:hypothetical protein